MPAQHARETSGTKGRKKERGRASEANCLYQWRLRRAAAPAAKPTEWVVHRSARISSASPSAETGRSRQGAGERHRHRGGQTASQAPGRDCLCLCVVPWWRVIKVATLATVLVAVSQVTHAQRRKPLWYGLNGTRKNEGGGGRGGGIWHRAGKLRRVEDINEKKAHHKSGGAAMRATK